GAMANTFLLAKDQEISQSKAEPEKVALAQELIKSLGSKLVLASDFVKKMNGEKFSYLDIGPESVAAFSALLMEAKTVFWNGSLGYTEEAPYDAGSIAIAQLLASLQTSGVQTVIAGGDTVELITRLKLMDKIGFVSTGGGAALEYLGGLELPGVAALEGAAAQGK
ncbi:MAG: phosphoglycerate kinase, partial [Methanothrix sp.]